MTFMSMGDLGWNSVQRWATFDGTLFRDVDGRPWMMGLWAALDGILFRDVARRPWIGLSESV